MAKPLTSPEERVALSQLLHQQALAMSLEVPAQWPEDTQWIDSMQAQLLEIEYTLIPEGMHVVGQVPTPAQRLATLKAMAKAMVALAQAKAKNRFGCETPLEANSFALGYMESLLCQVAAASPAAMKELEGALKYAKANQ